MKVFLFAAMLALSSLANAQFCKNSPPQRCRMFCRPSSCTNGQCWMRSGSCCAGACQEAVSSPTASPTASSGKGSSGKGSSGTTTTACTSDASCGTGKFCSYHHDGSPNVCATPTSKGGSCGGYRMASDKCAAGLKCMYQKQTGQFQIADAPGKCCSAGESVISNQCQSKPKCTNGKVINQCGSACPATCGVSTTMCTEQCVSGCFCPRGSKLSSTAKDATCVKSCPDSSDSSDSGVMCNGNKLPSGCTGFYDGCNKCTVRGSSCLCTKMYCFRQTKAFCAHYADGKSCIMSNGKLTCKGQGGSGTTVGGTVDTHGCKPSTGETWCAAHSKCERAWEIKCPSVGSSS